MMNSSEHSDEHVVILGASADRSKFGNKAVRANQRRGTKVYPVNPREVEIEGEKVYPDLESLPAGLSFDRVLVYLPPEIGISQLEALSKLDLKELWFNPGSESPELIEKANELGLSPIQACSIIGIGRSPAEFSD